MTLTVSRPDPKRTHAKITFEGPTLGLAFRPDATVKGVQPGGEAQTAGILVGDTVVTVGGTPASPRTPSIPTARAGPIRASR